MTPFGRVVRWSRQPPFYEEATSGHPSAADLGSHLKTKPELDSQILFDLPETIAPRVTLEINTAY